LSGVTSTLPPLLRRMALSATRANVAFGSSRPRPAGRRVTCRIAASSAERVSAGCAPARAAPRGSDRATPLTAPPLGAATRLLLLLLLLLLLTPAGCAHHQANPFMAEMQATAKYIAQRGKGILAR
jgi:hypothetical protein